MFLSQACGGGTQSCLQTKSAAVEEISKRGEAISLALGGPFKKLVGGDKGHSAQTLVLRGLSCIH